jgi:hypothetical protein
MVQIASSSVSSLPDVGVDSERSFAQVVRLCSRRFFPEGFEPLFVGLSMTATWMLFVTIVAAAVELGRRVTRPLRPLVVPLSGAYFGSSGASSASGATSSSTLSLSPRARSRSARSERRAGVRSEEAMQGSKLQFRASRDQVREPAPGSRRAQAHSLARERCHAPTNNIMAALTSLLVRVCPNRSQEPCDLEDPRCSLERIDELSTSEREY